MAEGDLQARERLFGWWGMLFAWLAWGLINTVRLRAQVPHIGWETAFWYGMPDAVIWAALTPLVVFLGRRAEVSERSFAQALPLHIAAALAVALLHSTADTTIAVVRNLASGQSALPGLIFRKILTHTLYLNLLMYFLVSGFAYYVRSTRRMAVRDRREAELRAQLTNARLHTLRMQLRPHFLFNALHTISSLMLTNPREGQRVVRQLGDLLRMSLRSGDRQTISLAEELELVEAYLGIEMARFGDRLQVDIEVASGIRDCRVPALILQPLVENAVRHGVSRNPMGGRVWIRAVEVGGSLRLEVRDDGPGLEGPPPSDGSQGVGLANTRERLEGLYGKAQAFSIETLLPKGVQVMIDLPFTRAAT